MNTWIQINVGWGFAVTFSALIVSKTSGGHLNPAVTMLFFTLKLIDFKTMIVYFISQVFGAFLGAAGVYVLYYGRLQHGEKQAQLVLQICLTPTTMVTDQLRVIKQLPASSPPFPLTGLPPGVHSLTKLLGLDCSACSWLQSSTNALKSRNISIVFFSAWFC